MIKLSTSGVPISPWPSLIFSGHYSLDLSRWAMRFADHPSNLSTSAIYLSADKFSLWSIQFHNQRSFHLIFEPFALVGLPPVPTPAHSSPSWESTFPCRAWWGGWPILFLLFHLSNCHIFTLSHFHTFTLSHFQTFNISHFHFSYCDGAVML